jgi:hypothetical protein
MYSTSVRMAEIESEYKDLTLQLEFVALQDLGR